MQQHTHAHTHTHLLLGVSVTTSVWEVTSRGWLTFGCVSACLWVQLGPLTLFAPPTTPPFSPHYPSPLQPVCPHTYMTPLLHPARNLPFTLLRSLSTPQHLRPLESLRCCAVSQSETSVGCVSNAVLWAPCVVSWPGLAWPGPVRFSQLHICVAHAGSDSSPLIN